MAKRKPKTVERKQTILPDGDYVMLADGRTGIHILADRELRVPGTDSDVIWDQYDRDAERSRTIAMARFQIRCDLNPDLDPAQPQVTLWQDRRYRFDPSLVSETSYFYGPPPPSEVHYDSVRDFANDPILDCNGQPCFFDGAYRIVSGAWKSAIEHMEPGVHEFFPHRIEFGNYTIYPHFIFRDAKEIDFVDHELSKSTAVHSDFIDGKVRYWTRTRPIGLAVKRERIAGRHWIRPPFVQWPVVSRELASALLPLLPDTIEHPNLLRFIPVKLV